MQDFMAGKLPPLPGELPTLNDWENHLTTIFPEVFLSFNCSIFFFFPPFVRDFDMWYISLKVRLKRYLEMRGADGGPWRRLCALPAFWVYSEHLLFLLVKDNQFTIYGPCLCALLNSITFYRWACCTMRFHFRIF